MRTAVEFYFANKIGKPEDREKVMEAFDLVARAKKTREKMKLVPERSGESEELTRARAAVKALFDSVGEMEDEPKAGVEAALDSLRELFGGEEAWRAYEVPSPESLGLDRLLDPAEFTRLSSMTPEQVTEELDRLPYVQEHFPLSQSAEDTARGLTRHRPNWWNQEAKLDVGAPAKKIIAPTWGLAYLRSIAYELQNLQGSTVLLDTATKPVYTDGSQHYGSTEGTDSSLDPLLPLFQEVFGENTNRFNHSWDELQSRLLPALKDKLLSHLSSRGLSSTDFDVILTPFHTDQQFMEHDSPESSSTNTLEWANTPFIDKDGSPSGRRLLAGNSVNGGSGYVVGFRPSDRNVLRGARLAVVIRRH
jgi:hypothetical protein